MRGQPRRNWEAARAKVEAEGSCRYCGNTSNLETAHILERALDRRDEYEVLPARVVPLCGLLPGSCHWLYDAHKLDIWHLLTIAEQGQAIEDAGNYWLAVKRCAPLAYREFSKAAA